MPRTLVAVGTARLASMLLTTRAAGPLSGIASPVSTEVATVTAAGAGADPLACSMAALSAEPSAGV